MIANAARGEDGTLSDLGNLSITVGELFVSAIYQVDEGITLGAAIEWGQNTKGEARDRYSPTFGYMDKDGVVYPTIGNGILTARFIYPTEAELNRDLYQANTGLSGTEVKPITAVIGIMPEEETDRVNQMIADGTLRSALGKKFVGDFSDAAVNAYDAAVNALEAAETLASGVKDLFTSQNDKMVSEQEDAVHTEGDSEDSSNFKDNHEAPADGDNKSTQEVLIEGGLSETDAKTLAARINSEVAEFIAEKDGKVTRAEIESFVKAKLEDAQFVNPTAFMTASIDAMAVSYAEVASGPLANTARVCAMHLACRLALVVASAVAAGYAFYQTHKAGENSESFPIHEDEGLIFTTPAKDKHKADIETFPADVETQSQLPGFQAPEYETEDEGFDIHSGDDMNVLYKKQKPDGDSSHYKQDWTSPDGKVTFKGETYHGNEKKLASRCSKSPDATAEGIALYELFKKSVSSGGQSTGRVVVDMENREIVEFRQTSVTDWHAHQTEWSDLTEKQKNNLADTGLIHRKKGKIIKF
jgi:hypothetical protein